MIQGRGREFPVIDPNGNIRGVIEINTIKDYLFEKDSLQNLLIAEDLSSSEFETIALDENCQAALDKMRKYDFEGLPVIESNNSKKIIGMIWMNDIQDAYQKEIDRRELTSNLASSITMKEDAPEVHFMEGYSIAEIKPPAAFIGHSIRDLNIRVKYGVDVLSIKTMEKKGEKIKVIPSPEYVITKKDKLLIAGEIKNINLLRNLG